MSKCVKYFVVGLIIFTASNLSFCQQLPLISMYRETYNYINAGAINYEYFRTGMTDYASLLCRKQWLNIAGSPTTFIGAYNRIGKKNEYGITLQNGITIISDKAGNLTNTGIYLNNGGIFRILQIGNYGEGLFSAGLSSGLVQYSLRVEDSAPRGVSDPVLTKKLSKISPDLGVGVNFTYHEDNYITSAGLSALQLLGRAIVFDEQNYKVKKTQHIYGNLNFQMNLQNTEQSYIEFNAWGRYVKNITPQVDINFRYHMGEFIWFGFGYGFQKSFTLDAGFKISLNGSSNYLKVGYGYSTNFNYVIQSNGGTHEIMLQYIWGGDTY